MWENFEKLTYGTSKTFLEILQAYHLTSSNLSNFLGGANQDGAVSAGGRGGGGGGGGGQQATLHH